jgi:hypothetical protein
MTKRAKTHFEVAVPISLALVVEPVCVLNYELINVRKRCNAMKTSWQKHAVDKEKHTNGSRGRWRALKIDTRRRRE